MALSEIRGIIHEIKQPENVTFGSQTVAKQELIIREPKTTDRGKDQFIALEAWGDVVQQTQNLQLHMEVLLKVSIGGNISTPNQQYPDLKVFTKVKVLEVNVMGQQAPQQQQYQPPAQQYQVQQQAPQQVPAFQGQQQQYQPGAPQGQPVQQPIQNPPRQAAPVHPMAPPAQVQQQYPAQGQPQQAPIQQGPPAGTFEPPQQGGYAGSAQAQEDDIPF